MVEPGNPFKVYELDFQVALRTAIPDLPKLCAQNKTFNTICNDEIFWRQRLGLDFPDRFKLKDKNFKESYRFWYQAKVKARPFGYYADDGQVLEEYRLTISRSSYTLLTSINETLISPDSTNMTIILGELLSRVPVTGQPMSYLSLFHMLAYNRINLIEFTTKLFKLFGLDRLIMTLPESIDFLACSLHFLRVNYSTYQSIEQKKIDQRKFSIISSLSQNQITELQLLNNYQGYPDYPSRLYSVLSGKVLQMSIADPEGDPSILNPENVIAGPNRFDIDRYRMMKQFDLIKIVWLSISYSAKIGGYIAFPPYLYVSLCKPNERLEDLYRKVNENNYIEMLRSLGIRSDDNPNYYQALGRLTAFDGLLWTTRVRSFKPLIFYLGLPLRLIEVLDSAYDLGDPDDWEERSIQIIESYLLAPGY